MLVLEAEGLSPEVHHTSQGFALAVPAGEAIRASEALAAYDSENTPEETVEDEPQGTGYLKASITVAGILVMAFLITGAPGPGNHWFQRGSANAAYLLDGEWWRSLTALTLHMDAAHLLSNTLAMLLFLTGVCRYLGPGLGCATVLVAAAAGNTVNAVVQGPQHVSVGASTAVFAAVGVLVSLAVARRRRALSTGRRNWVPIAAGLAILAMLGTGQNRVDLWAHLLGLAAGGILGGAASLYRHRAADSATQWTLMGASLMLLMGCWTLALRY